MSWRHPSSAIDDLKPPAGSYSQEYICRLSDHVVKLANMPEGLMDIHDFLCLPEWIGAEVQEELHHDTRPTLQRLPFYYTPLAVVDSTISDPTPGDLATGTPSAKVMAKAEASKKRKASISGAALSHVTKRTRSVMSLSFKSTSRRNLFVGDNDEESDNDDACIEIPLITLIRSAITILARENYGGGSKPSAAEGPSHREVPVALKLLLLLLLPSGIFPVMPFIKTSSFFFPGPYYATYPVDGVVAGSYEIEALTNDQLAAKISVLYCLMMSHGGELLARYRGLLKYHHDHVQSANSRLRSLKDRCTAYQGLESQVFGFQKHVADLNDNLSSFYVAFVKDKSKGKDRNKKIKSLYKNLDQLTTEVARLSSDLNQAKALEAEKDVEIFRDEFSRVWAKLLSLAASTGFERGLSIDQTQKEFDVVLKKISHFVPDAQGRLTKASPLVTMTDYPFLKKISDHATHPLFTILHLEPKRLAHRKDFPPPKTARVSTLLTKESTPSAKQNEEWVRVMVDMLDNENVDGAVGLTASAPSDVVVGLSVQEKGRGSPSSQDAPNTAVTAPSGV
ncbi:hypothetical protein Tco_1407294 [Tanacetum coccineum]